MPEQTTLWFIIHHHTRCRPPATRGCWGGFGMLLSGNRLSGNMRARHVLFGILGERESRHTHLPMQIFAPRPRHSPSAKRSFSAQRTVGWWRAPVLLPPSSLSVPLRRLCHHVGLVESSVRPVLSCYYILAWRTIFIIGLCWRPPLLYLSTYRERRSCSSSNNWPAPSPQPMRDSVFIYRQSTPPVGNNVINVLLESHLCWDSLLACLHAPRAFVIIYCLSAGSSVPARPPDFCSRAHHKRWLIALAFRARNVLRVFLRACRRRGILVVLLTMKRFPVLSAGVFLGRLVCVLRGGEKIASVAPVLFWPSGTSASAAAGGRRRLFVVQFVWILCYVSESAAALALKLPTGFPSYCCCCSSLLVCESHAALFVGGGWVYTVRCRIGANGMCRHTRLWIILCVFDTSCVFWCGVVSGKLTVDWNWERGKRGAAFRYKYRHF